MSEMIQQKIRVLVADDHPHVVKGLSELITETPDLLLVGTAKNGIELVKEVNLKKPDVVITDIRMPEMDGLEAASIIHQQYPNIALIALTADDRKFLVSTMFRATFKGILLKSSSSKETIVAIRTVFAGGEYYCTGSVAILKLLTRKKLFRPKDKSIKRFLSEQQEKILMLVCEGLSSIEIGEQLSLSRRTVDMHRNKITEKSKTKNLAELVKWAIHEGYVSVKSEDYFDNDIA